MSCDMVQKRVYVFVFLEGQKIYKEKKSFLRILQLFTSIPL